MGENGRFLASSGIDRKSPKVANNIRWFFNNLTVNRKPFKPV